MIPFHCIVKVVTPPVNLQFCRARFLNHVPKILVEWHWACQQQTPSHPVPMVRQTEQNPLNLWPDNHYLELSFSQSVSNTTNWQATIILDLYWDPCPSPGDTVGDWLRGKWSTSADGSDGKGTPEPLRWMKIGILQELEKYISIGFGCPTWTSHDALIIPSHIPVFKVRA